MDTIYIAVIVILIGVCIFAFMRPPNCPACPVCPDCPPPKCPACPPAPTCPSCPPPPPAPSCPAPPPAPTCPTCANEPRLGLKYKPVNDQVKQLIEKAQNIFTLGQESACGIAKNIYTQAKPEFSSSLKTAWARGDPKIQTCDWAKTEFANVVNSVYNNFVQNVTRPRYTYTYEPVQQQKVSNVAGGTTQVAMQEKQVLVTPSPYEPSPADYITIATKVRPLITDIANHVISMVCEGGKITPDKIVQALDDVFNSLCY